MIEFSENDMQEVVHPLRRCTEALAHSVAATIDYILNNSVNHENQMVHRYQQLGDEILRFVKEPDETDLLDNNHDDTYPEEEDI